MPELLSIFSKSHRFAPAVSLSMLCGLVCGLPITARAQAPAQMPAQVAAQTQGRPTPEQADPTRHQLQPRLDVDRDPVLSPDPADNEVGSTASALTKDANSNVYTLRQNVEEVLLRCAVVDAKGNLVDNLTQGNFRVWEDGVPQTISSFQHRDQPASIGLLVDNSGSMLDKRAAVNAAALELVKESNPKDTAFVVNFSDRAYLDQGFTSDFDAIQKGLAHFDSRGPTALYDAVDASANELAQHAKWPEQVLVIVTDGRDDASRLSLEQTVRRVQQLGGPVIYTIGLLYEADSKEEAQQAHDVLETLSAETGGLAYFPRSLDEVQGIAEMVARDIRNQYIVGYHSPDISKGGYRTVRVEAQANGYGKLIVRTRKGYYPEKLNPGSKPAQKIAAAATTQPAK